MDMKIIETNRVFNSEPAIWDIVFELIEKYFHAPATVADLGCGYHHWTAEDTDIIRIDTNPPHVGKEYIKHDLNIGIPLQDKQVDYGIAVELLEHLENPIRFLMDLRRVVKKAVIITHPNGLDSGWYNIRTYLELGHITILTDWLTESHLKKTGYTVVSESYINSRKEIVIFLAKP